MSSTPETIILTVLKRYFDDNIAARNNLQVIEQALGDTAPEDIGIDTALLLTLVKEQTAANAILVLLLRDIRELLGGQDFTLEDCQA